jgi:acyl carrier protein
MHGFTMVLPRIKSAVASDIADLSDTDEALRAILVDVLGLKRDRAAGFTAKTGLFGHLPELDSMAVAGLLTEIEDRLHIVIDDDEVDGDLLESYGSLLAFVEAKRAH